MQTLLANKLLADWHGKATRKKPTPPKVGESYFATCKRDDEGHCLPKGESPGNPLSNDNNRFSTAELRPDDDGTKLLEEFYTASGGNPEEAGHGHSEISQALMMDGAERIVLRGQSSPNKPIIGAVAFVKDEDPGKYSGWLSIQHLGSTGATKGVGTNLIEMVAQRAAQEKTGIIFESTHNAESFYEKMGFRHLDSSQSKIMGADPEEVMKILEKIQQSKMPHKASKPPRKLSSGLFIEDGQLYRRTPSGLRQWIREYDEGKSLDYEIKEGFSGRKRDKLGRNRCYAQGKPVACNIGTTPVAKKPPKQQQAAQPKRTKKAPPKEEQPSEKAMRAKAAHKLIDKEVQRYAEEYNEPRFAKMVKGISHPDNEFKDVSNDTDLFELKTMVSNKNDKITMDTYAQIRKIVGEKAEGKTFHTVISDDQSVYNALGEGKHDDSKRRYFYRRGVAGSARIGAMYACKSKSELLQLIAMDEDDLPDAAQRTDGKLRKGAWKPFQDKIGKGFKNKKTGQIVRAKK